MLDMPDVPFNEQSLKYVPVFSSPEGSVYRNGITNLIFFKKKNKWIPLYSVNIENLSVRNVIRLKESILFDDFPDFIKADIEKFLSTNTDSRYVVFPNRGCITSTKSNSLDYS